MFNSTYKLAELTKTSAAPTLIPSSAKPAPSAARMSLSIKHFRFSTVLLPVPKQTPSASYY